MPFGQSGAQMITRHGAGAVMTSARWWACASSAADRVWPVFVRTDRPSHKAKFKEHPRQYHQRANDED